MLVWIAKCGGSVSEVMTVCAVEIRTVIVIIIISDTVHDLLLPVDTNTESQTLKLMWCIVYIGSCVCCDTVPHQPRLDWQMWFAALGTYQHNPWFLNLVYRLLMNEREGLEHICLLKRNRKRIDEERTHVRGFCLTGPTFQSYSALGQSPK